MATPSELERTGADIAARARDAAYVAVGLGVLGVQRAQIQREELRRELRQRMSASPGGPELVQRVAGLRQDVSAGVAQLDGLVGAAAAFVEAGAEPFYESLPPPAREVIERGTAAGARLRRLVLERL